LERGLPKVSSRGWVHSGAPPLIGFQDYFNWLHNGRVGLIEWGRQWGLNAVNTFTEVEELQHWWEFRNFPSLIGALQGVYTTDFGKSPKCAEKLFSNFHQQRGIYYHPQEVDLILQHGRIFKPA